MSEILKPVEEFDVVELGIELNHLVKQPVIRSMLYDRNFLGTANRYGGDVHDAIKAVEKLQSQKVRPSLAAFAIVEASGDVAGMATFCPSLKLRKLRLPIAPKLAKGVLSKEYSGIGFNVSAWTKEAHIDNAQRPLLRQAYEDLLAVDRLPGDGPNTSYTGARWTLETKESSMAHHMLDILSEVGFRATDFAHFDDQESQLHVPPKSYLLVAPKNSQPQG